MRPSENQSSLVMIGLSNNLGYPDSLNMPIEVYTDIVVFRTYTAEQLLQILQLRAHGLFDDRSANYLTMRLHGCGKSHCRGLCL